MTTAINGIICYGFNLSTDDKNNNDEWCENEPGKPIEFTDFISELYGLAKLIYCQDCKHEYEDNCGDCGDQEKILKMLEEHRHKQTEIINRVNVELVQYCSDKYPKYILAIKDSVKEVRRGDVLELGQSLSTKAEWPEQLRLFCEKANITFQEPQLLLVSYWV